MVFGSYMWALAAISPTGRCCCYAYTPFMLLAVISYCELTIGRMPFWAFFIDIIIELAAYPTIELPTPFWFCNNPCEPESTGFPVGYTWLFYWKEWKTFSFPWLNVPPFYCWFLGETPFINALKVRPFSLFKVELPLPLRFTGGAPFYLFFWPFTLSRY